MNDADCGVERRGGSVVAIAQERPPFDAALPCSSERHPIAMRINSVLVFGKKVFADWAKRHLAHPGTAVASDGLGCFPGITDADWVVSGPCTAVVIVTSGSLAGMRHAIFGWVNTILVTSRTRCMVPTMHRAPSICSAISSRSPSTSMTQGH